MADQFETSIRALRLAQKVAQTIVASEVPPQEWGTVLKFLKVIIARKGGPPVDDEGPQPPADSPKRD